MYDYITEINSIKKFIKEFKFDEFGFSLDENWTYQQNSTHKRVFKEFTYKLKLDSFPTIITYEKKEFMEIYTLHYSGSEKRNVEYYFSTIDYLDKFLIKIYINFYAIVIYNGKNIDIEKTIGDKIHSDENSRLFLLKYFREKFNKLFDIEKVYLDVIKVNFNILEEEWDILLELYPDLISYCKQLPEKFIEKHRNDSEVRNSGVLL